MKKKLKKILLYSFLFVLLLLVGAFISDGAVIIYAKYILRTADSLAFEKDMKKVYPSLKDEENGLTLIRQVYTMRQQFPDELKALDEKITFSDTNSAADIQNSLRNPEYSAEEADKFWTAPQVTAVLDKLSSVPYTTKFSFNFADDHEKLEENLFMIRRMHNFYLHYLKYCSVKGEKLKTLHVLQKLFVLNRALEKQNLQVIEKCRMDLWLNSIDAIVHYGPYENRYSEYYSVLQKLVKSIEFEYCAELACRYNDLKKALDFNAVKADNIFVRRNCYIYNVKKAAKNLYEDIINYPLEADVNRTEMLDKDIFAKQSLIIKEQLDILMAVKLYQQKHSEFPEAIEGLGNFSYIDEFIYKRISADDFVLMQKN